MKLNQIVGITKILCDRKIPEDIEKYLESDYWSGSKKQFLKKGDMDLFHFIRAVISDNKKQWDIYNGVEDKLHKIQKIMEE